jgi:hypothetical protein
VVLIINIHEVSLGSCIDEVGKYTIILGFGQQSHGDSLREN